MCSDPSHDPGDVVTSAPRVDTGGVFSDAIALEPVDAVTLTTLVDNSTDLLQSVDALGGFVQVNPAWKRLLGYTDDDLKHLNLFDVVAPEDAAIVEDR